MSDMKPKGPTVNLGGKEYGMRFTINVIDDIQDKFDVPVAQLPEVLKDQKTQIKNLKYLVALMINEDIACREDETGEKLPRVDERFVGRHVDKGNLPELIRTIYSTASSHSPDAPEGENPNATSE